VIIDVHSHLGHDRVFSYTISEEQLMGEYDRNEVTAGIVQPAVVQFTPQAQVSIHSEVHTLTQKYAGRIYGMASLCPHFSPEFYHAEMTRAVRELGFVGIKLSPIAHATNPLSEDGRMVFEVARELGVPVMVHIGKGVPFTLPSLLLPIAKEFKETPIILAHAGAFAQESLIVARERENIYLETSWTEPSDCKEFVAGIGARRVMFASDMWDNQSAELAKWRSLRLGDSDLEWVMAKTASEVYRISPY
jgi:uncharacterized protein